MGSEEKKNVLVVDDDFDIRQTLKDVLDDAGYTGAFAADGFEALHYLRNNPAPGIILLDWMMPRCDGAMFRAEQLKEPALAAIPVILLTADMHATERMKTLNTAGVLRKPVRLPDLLATIERYCGSTSK